MFRMFPLTIDELGDNIHDYCPLDDYQKGVHGTPNGYSACEGCCCDMAYESYLEEFENDHKIYKLIVKIWKTVNLFVKR